MLKHKIMSKPIAHGLIESTKSRCRRLGASLLLLVGLTGCDFEVTNPGPIEDALLTDADVFQAVVNGIKRNLNQAYHYIGINSAIRSRELHIAELDTWRRVSFKQHVGQGDPEPQLDPWWYVTDARWLAEDAIRRAGEIWEPAEFASTAVVAEAHLWNGYTHRVFADFYCQVVFDGGVAQDNDVALQRAEESFTTAIEIASAAGHTEFANAGRAGRASVRIQLGDWAGAVADAGAVPTDFSYVLPFGDEGGENRLNYFAYGDMIRAHTVWHTFYDEYFQETGDPRVPWVVDPEIPIRQTSLEPWTELPWKLQTKYTSVKDAIEVSSGEEMRLTEAEGALRNGNMATAMTLINDLRARAGVDPWPEPANLEEAWSYLKKERGIELWLEARRLSDHRRWREDGTPGALDKWEIGGIEGEPDLTNADLCMPLSQAEIDRNTNLD